MPGILTLLTEPRQYLGQNNTLDVEIYASGNRSPQTMEQGNGGDAERS
jgi:hypothetical protein